MDVIKGYTLLGELSAQNAGFCQWGFCRKSDREYFIKELLTPVYPTGTEKISPDLLTRKRQLCDNFYNEKKNFYNVLNCCRTGNIVQIVEFFRFGSKYYIVTDKVFSDGTDPQIIACLSNEEKLVFLRALLYSVARFHHAGIIHADLKPDNILLKKTEKGCYTAKIIDFDAGFLKEKTPTEVQGDFLYLSPEAYLKMSEEPVELTEKLDIFALGILLYQYWTGKLPSLGSDYRYVFEAVLDGSEVHLADSIPLNLRTLISRMLSKDPASRPDADEILQKIQLDTDHRVSGTLKVFMPSSVPAGFRPLTDDDL